VLPPAHRIRRRDEFASVVRHGRRAGGGSLVVHVRCRSDGSDGELAEADVPRAGFVVSKAVGGSVVRHQVVRRLRALMAPRLATLPRGTLVVVRALPASASASSQQLGRDLDRALDRALDHPLTQPAPGGVA
jgi:ribonuclease P protein component